MKHLAVFARWPIPGQVKTRLSPALPPALACDLYRALLADTLAAAAAASVDSRRLYWADAPTLEVPFPGAEPFEPHVQHGADLGARLEDAFAGMLTRPRDRAVVIGSDAPGVTAARIDKAFAALELADVAVGPASDGGYWLIGLAAPAPALFRDVHWSTEHVLAQTLERAAAHRHAVSELMPLPDLDTPADLVRLIAAAANGEAIGAQTAAALRAMRLLPEDTHA